MDWKKFQKSGSAGFLHLLNYLHLQNLLELVTAWSHLLKLQLYLITDCSALVHIITHLIPLCNCQEVATVSLLRLTQDSVCWDKAAAIGQASQCFWHSSWKKMLPIFKGILSLTYLCIEPVNSAFSRARVKLKKKHLVPFTVNLKQTCSSIFLWVDWHFSLCFISRIGVIRQPLHVVHPPGLLSRPKAQSSL